MNIHVEIKRYQSQAEMVQEAKARQKRFEMAGRLAKIKKAAPPIAVTESPKPFVTRKAPLWELGCVNFDAHIAEYHLRKVSPALTYVKDRCAELGWALNTIMGPQRRQEVVRVRQLLMWEISEKFPLSLPQIGRMFGGRDHTTVLHAIRRVEKLRKVATGVHQVPTETAL